MTHTLESILGSYGVMIVPTKKRRAPGETHAAGTLRQIHRDRGAEHLCLVLALIRGSSHHREQLNSETFGAISDILVQAPQWVERFPDLVAAFERVNVKGIRQRCYECRPWPVRHSLRAYLYNVLERLLEPPAAGQGEPIGIAA